MTFALHFPIFTFLLYISQFPLSTITHGHLLQRLHETGNYRATEKEAVFLKTQQL